MCGRPKDELYALRRAVFTGRKLDAANTSIERVPTLNPELWGCKQDVLSALQLRDSRRVRISVKQDQYAHHANRKTSGIEFSIMMQHGRVKRCYSEIARVNESPVSYPSVLRAAETLDTSRPYNIMDVTIH